MDQHRSRDRIHAILNAAGKPLRPKQICDAQSDMKYPAVRRLLPEMWRDGVLGKEPGLAGGYYAIASLSPKQVKAERARQFDNDLCSLIRKYMQPDVRQEMPSDIEKLLRSGMQEILERPFPPSPKRKVKR